MVLRRDLTSWSTQTGREQDYRSFELPNGGPVVWPEFCRMSCAQDLGAVPTLTEPGYGGANAICYLKPAVPGPEADGAVSGVASTP